MTLDTPVCMTVRGGSWYTNREWRCAVESARVYNTQGFRVFRPSRIPRVVHPELTAPVVLWRVDGQRRVPWT